MLGFLRSTKTAPPPAAQEMTDEGLTALLEERQRLDTNVQQRQTGMDALSRARRAAVESGSLFPTSAEQAEAERQQQALDAANGAFAAHVAAHGDLGSISQSLRVNRQRLEQAELKAAHKVDASAILRIGAELSTVLARCAGRQEDALRRWPKGGTPDGLLVGAGLPDIAFPPGIFDQTDCGYGFNALGVYENFVKENIAEGFPDLIEAAPARQPRKYPGLQDWQIRRNPGRPRILPGDPNT